MGLEALEPVLRVDRERVVLGLERVELGLEHRDPDLALLDLALDPLDPGLESIEAFGECGMSFGDHLHVAVDALQQDFEPGAVFHGHSGLPLMCR